MRKTIFFYFSFLISAFLLSCASSSNKVLVFNESLNAKETATINWTSTNDWGNLRVASYNGTKVNWEIVGFNSFLTIKNIPPGDIIFELEGESTPSGISKKGSPKFPNYSSSSTWDGKSFSYNFEAGKEYTVFLDYLGDVSIYNGKSKKIKNLIHRL
jgi:hypothetical protein